MQRGHPCSRRSDRLIRVVGRTLALAITVLASGCPGMNQTPAPETSARRDRGASVDLYPAFQGDVRALLDCLKLTRRSVVVAHRGGFAPGVPENSLAALERSIHAASMVLEIDVVSSEDGINFLHHDETLERTTSGRGPVTGATWASISGLRLRDNSGRLTNHRPVSLDVALARLRGRAFIMLDLKAPVRYFRGSPRSRRGGYASRDSIHRVQHRTGAAPSGAHRRVPLLRWARVIATRSGPSTTLTSVIFLLSR